MTSKTPTNPPSGDLEKRLREILPNAHYGGQEDDGWEKEELDDAIKDILTTIKDAGYIEPKFSVWTPDKKQEPQTPEQKAYSDKIFKDAVPYMTGQEFYDRFEREYHLRADWIAGDPEMGDDAEHDVLLAARLAAGIDER